MVPIFAALLAVIVLFAVIFLMVMIQKHKSKGMADTVEILHYLQFLLFTYFRGRDDLTESVILLLW